MTGNEIKQNKHKTFTFGMHLAGDGAGRSALAGCGGGKGRKSATERQEILKGTVFGCAVLNIRSHMTQMILFTYSTWLSVGHDLYFLMDKCFSCHVRAFGLWGLDPVCNLCALFIFYVSFVFCKH